MLVARSLGATLVIPDIRGSQPGDKRLVLRKMLMQIASPISVSSIVEHICEWSGVEWSGVEGVNFASF